MSDDIGDIEVQAQVFRNVEAAARTAYSKTLATSSGETLDRFVMLYESDEQLRERCEAKMRREFKP